MDRCAGTTLSQILTANVTNEICKDSFGNGKRMKDSIEDSNRNSMVGFSFSVSNAISIRVPCYRDMTSPNLIIYYSPQLREFSRSCMVVETKYIEFHSL